MTILRLIALIITLPIQNTMADVLELTDGTSLTGTYAGGNRTRIRFEVEGKIRNIHIDDVKSLTFERTQKVEKPTVPSARRPERPTVTTPQLQLTRTGKPNLTINKGTLLSTHLTGPIGTDISKRNARFKVHLSKAISKGTRLLVPQDTQFNGRIVRSQAIKQGKAILTIELTSAQIDNHIYTLISNRVQLECDGDLLTVTSGTSAFDSETALGDFITESGDIHLPQNTPIIFELTSPLTLPEP